MIIKIPHLVPGEGWLYLKISFKYKDLFFWVGYLYLKKGDLL